MKLLVTGAGGYIGSIATYLLLQKGYEVVAIDNFSTGFHEPLIALQEKFGKDKLRFYEYDIQNNINELFEKEKDIKGVLHYAACCKVDESMKMPEKYFQNNTCGSLNLLRTLDAYGIRTIVFSSTCAVYGEAQHIPLDENHPTNPTNPYGESKRMVEKMIEWYGTLKNFHYIIYRYFNICGASDDGLIGDSKKPSVLLVQNIVRGALGIEPFFLTCAKVDTPDGTPIRDYINVVDLNEAHVKGIEYLLAGGQSEKINLGTGTGNSVLEVVKKVQEATGKTFEMQSTTPRQGEYAKAIASIEKANRVLGWEPKRSIADSVNSLITWYNAHPNGWNR